MKRAFVTGITGQDGSYLAEFLLNKGYAVHGLIRRSSRSNLSRISALCEEPSIRDRFFLHEGDLGDSTALKQIIELISPHEIYNLGAVSQVKASFEMPEYTSDVDGIGVLRLLEAIRSFDSSIRFYQASTAELYGRSQETPQSEKTPFYPHSPYGVAKLYAFWIVVNYRETYGLHASNGILFNHESPRRGETFFSKKIAQGIARIARGLQEKIVLGNLNSNRDWGYAKDFVEGMWMMLQKEKGDDFVLATGKTKTVREFVELAFRTIGVDLTWEGEGIEERGKDNQGKTVVEVSPQLFRPSETRALIGDPSKAKKELGWVPCTSVEELVKIMVHFELDDIDFKHSSSDSFCGIL